MKRISTHVLDLMRGRPASDVPVRLERRESADKWHEVSKSRTDQDGRCGQLLAEDVLTPGIYRLSFDTSAYFGAHKMATLFPVVEVTFQVQDGESNFHIPLLLSANGYTTYRGS